MKLHINSLISVIVPCYKQAQYLPETLNSVHLQTYQNWECIIVNDGSPDNTEEVALEWCKKDVRFKYIRKDNGGLSSARNKGLSVARGEFIQFLDSDDLIDSNKFCLQIEQLKEDNKVAVCDYFPFDDFNRSYKAERYRSPFFDTDSIKKDIITAWEDKISFPPHCLLVPAKLIFKNNLWFDEQLSNHEDWLFWCQLFFYSSGVIYQKEKLAKYRVQDNSMCKDDKKMAVGYLEAANKIMLFYKNLREEELFFYAQLKQIDIRRRNKKIDIIHFLDFARRIKRTINL